MSTAAGVIPQDTGTPPAAAAVDPGTPPAGAAATPAAAPTDFRATIPEAFRSENYLRDVKSADDVFKMLHNSQQLIGKQGKSRPADDAAPEAWDAYYASQGRPEAPDKYEFQRAEGEVANPELDKKLKDVYFKYGVHPKEAKAVQGEIESIINGTVAEMEKAEEAAFTKMTDEVFGGREQANKAIETATKLIDQLCPPQAKKFLNGMTNESLTMVAAIMAEVQKKYVGEDATRLGGSGGGSGDGLNTAAAIEAEGTRLMQTPEFKDPFHKDHAAMKEKVAAVYAKLNNLK